MLTVSLSTEQNYLERQPKLPRPADAYILRNVLHDWSDKYAREILRNLREFAKANTKLMIVDAVTEYACATPSLTAGDVVPGYRHTTAPRPLLPNLGAANAIAYNMDIAVRVPVGELS